MKRLLFFWDCEATDKIARKSAVIGLGAVIGLDRGTGLELTTDSWERLVKPWCEIPEFVEKLTGITNERVAAEKEFPEVFEAFGDWVHEKIQCYAPEDVVFVSYNGLAYDEVLLLSEAQRWRPSRFPDAHSLFSGNLGATHLLDPYRMALVHPETKKLPSRTQPKVFFHFYKRAPHKAHEALADAQALAAIVLAMGPYDAHLRSLRGTC